MPRFRFTIRRMMIAVAIIATATAVANCWSRRQSRLRKAEDLRLSEMMLIATARDLAPNLPQPFGSRFKDKLPDGTPIRVEGLGTSRVVFIPANSKNPADYPTVSEAIESLQKEAARIHRLRQIYERAARYPWLPVSPSAPG